MIIGIPKEIKEQEQRVSLLPSAAEQLTRRAHSVLVEKNAGVGTGYPDEDYVKAGAEIVDQAKEVFARADMIVKVKEPLRRSFRSCAGGRFFSPICTWPPVNRSRKRC